MMTEKEMAILSRWEAMEDLPGEETISCARKDVSYLLVELGIARGIIRKMATAHLPSAIFTAREEAWAYLAGLGEISNVA
jgi:hypothetical protein